MKPVTIAAPMVKVSAEQADAEQVHTAAHAHDGPGHGFGGDRDQIDGVQQFHGILRTDSLHRQRALQLEVRDYGAKRRFNFMC